MSDTGHPGPGDPAPKAGDERPIVVHGPVQGLVQELAKGRGNPLGKARAAATATGRESVGERRGPAFAVQGRDIHAGRPAGPASTNPRDT